MMLDLIETLKMSVYNPKNIKNSKKNSTQNKKITNSIFFNNKQFKNQRFMLIIMALFIFLRATQPN